MTHQDVFIVGATGNVGKTLVSQIYEKQDTCSTLHTNPTRIVGLASSKKYHFNPQGIDPIVASKFCSLSDDVSHDYVSPDQFLALTEGKVTFIDATAAKKEMLHFHKLVRADNHRLVTANKNPLVDCDYDTFRSLTRDVAHYGYRCSVMAGAEAVNLIKNLRDVGDVPLEISGCFSGTLGYVSSELEKGRKLSEIVRQAKVEGYTEPHPAEDLSGFDVAKKICILARTAGYAINLSDIALTPFIPEQYLRQPNIDRFLDSLHMLDANFEEQVRAAKKDNCVLRYVAEFRNGTDRPTLSIGLQKVPRDSPLGVLQGTRNKIVVKTRTHGNNFYAVEAPGAGLDVTAQNIRVDLLGMIEHRIMRD